MSEYTPSAPADPVSEMQGLIRSIYENGYTELDQLQRFIILYNEYEVPGDRDRVFELFDKLDAPDVGLEFHEETFDEVVEAYDNLGGSWAATQFPDTAREPPTDWGEELETLKAIFEEDTDTPYPQSHALYVRTHAQELEQADPDGATFQALLRKPQFLAGLVKVYQYEEFEAEETYPETWPDVDDNFMKKVLEAVGYKYSSRYMQDWTSRKDDITMDNILPNFRAIAQLELARSGATKDLSEQFGIRHFERYPAELLVAQFDTQGKTDRPYGIAISAVSDHNGALSSGRLRSSHTTTGDLYSQIGTTRNMYVAEAETVTEFEQRIKYFDELNGEQYKIDFALIDSHGSPETIRLGWSRDVGSLAVSARLSEVKDVFSPSASVVMTGCATGRINGIAQSLSRQFDTTVVAPWELVGPTSIALVSGTEGLRLIPHYSDSHDGKKVEAMVYTKGALLRQAETNAYLNIEGGDL